MSLSEDILKTDERLRDFENRLDRRYGGRVQALALPSRRGGVPEDILTVGLVGGTGVGKSSLVNALAGNEISRTSSRRPTTDKIIPYIHSDRSDALDAMEFLAKHLSRDRAIHSIEKIRYLALFDLPDIDSLETRHAEVVKAALKGLDLVVWVTSLTKFGDRVFHDWIRTHGQGMSTSNFVFVLNKVDEIDKSEAVGGFDVLRKNFSKAVLDSLGSEKRTGDSKVSREGEGPKFFLLSAAPRGERPTFDQFDAFRDFLFAERDSRELAKIKSSNRGAELSRRHAHLVKSLDIEARLAWLQGDQDFAAERVLEELKREDVKQELHKVLRDSPVQSSMAREYFRHAIASWPLLPRVGFLTAPFKGLPRLLEQIANLTSLDAMGTGPAPAKKRDPLLEAFHRIEEDRRRRRSRLPDPKLGVALSAPSSSDLERRRTRLQNECDARLQEALEIQSYGPPSTPVIQKRWWKRLLIWTPLLWFPLMQPLLEDILNPAHDLWSLPGRLVYRLVRITGATHLLVSLIFVLLMYLSYVLILRGLAWARAARECRAILETEWWTKTLEERLTSLLVQENSEVRDIVEKEQDELRSLEQDIKKLGEKLTV